MKNRLLWFFFICFLPNTYSQIIISGNLKSNVDEPVQGASVVLTANGEDRIIAYDISDGDGNYLINHNFEYRTFNITVKSMGFESISEVIDNKAQIKNFVLQEAVTALKEVVVKSGLINKRGDTINYVVEGFAKLEDRTIADVMENMPGIEVLPDGKILYEGRPINKYYIEGLDLLEGRYNLANKNLPYAEVSSVQILENHQPIKVLDSLVFSDRAALNIKLKNNYSVTGQAAIGAGFSPTLWNANLTPMLFSNKQQVLGSYQTNNIGNNVASQLKALTIDELLNQFERNDNKKNWLAIEPLAEPGFSELKWLDNSTHLVSVNYLKKFKKDYELRYNLSYVNDYQQQNGGTNTRFFTPNDTIGLLETKRNQFYLNSFNGDITLQKNVPTNYLKNSLQFQGFWDGQRGNLQLNNDNIIQNSSNRYFKISNNLKTYFPVGKQLVNLSSYLGVNRTPQKLEVSPGQFNDLLNNGNPYERVVQDIDLRTFYTNNSVGFTKGWKRFTFSPKVGIQIERQNLNSDILESVN